MSQKSSLPQAAKSVSQVLMSDTRQWWATIGRRSTQLGIRIGVGLVNAIALANLRNGQGISCLFSFSAGRVYPLDDLTPNRPAAVNSTAQCALPRLHGFPRNGR